jgi:queuine/archaeosine tRNA-ribosyltransferase
VPGRKDENMVEETITQIEARIKKAKSLNDERKKELIDLLSTLKTEVSQLSKTDAEDAQSIIGFTEVSIHEAIREEKHPQLLKLSLKGLSTSVKRFENSHPKLVRIVNSICNTLSNIGI